MDDAEQLLDVDACRPRSGASVQAFSVGDGWLLEIVDAVETLDLFLARGADLDLFSLWCEDVLTLIGAHPCSDWAAAAAASGSTEDFALSHS